MACPPQVAVFPFNEIRAGKKVLLKIPIFLTSRAHVQVSRGSEARASGHGDSLSCWQGGVEPPRVNESYDHQDVVPLNTILRAWRLLTRFGETTRKLVASRHSGQTAEPDAFSRTLDSRRPQDRKPTQRKPEATKLKTKKKQNKSKKSTRN